MSAHPPALGKPLAPVGCSAWFGSNILSLARYIPQNHYSSLRSKGFFVYCAGKDTI